MKPVEMTTIAAAANGVTELPAVSKTSSVIRVELRDTSEDGSESQKAAPVNGKDLTDQHDNLDLCSLVSAMSVSDTAPSIGDANRIEINLSFLPDSPDCGNLELDFARVSLKDYDTVPCTTGNFETEEGDSKTQIVKVQVEEDDSSCSAGLSSQMHLSLGETELVKSENVDVTQHRREPQENLEPENDDDDKTPGLIPHGPTGGVAVNPPSSVYYGYPPMMSQYGGQQACWSYSTNTINDCANLPSTKYRKPTVDYGPFVSAAATTTVANVPLTNMYHVAQHLSGGTMMFEDHSAVGGIIDEFEKNLLDVHTYPSVNEKILPNSYGLPQQELGMTMTSIDSFVEDVLCGSVNHSEFEEILRNLDDPTVGPLFPCDAPALPNLGCGYDDTCASVTLPVVDSHVPLMPPFDAAVDSPLTDILSECWSPSSSTAAVDTFSESSVQLPFVGSPDSGIQGDSSDAFERSKVLDLVLDIQEEKKRDVVAVQWQPIPPHPATVNNPLNQPPHCPNLQHLNQATASSSSPGGYSNYYNHLQVSALTGASQLSPVVPVSNFTDVTTNSPCVPTLPIQPSAFNPAHCGVPSIHLPPLMTTTAGGVFQFTTPVLPLQPVTCCVIMPPQISVSTMSPTQRPLQKIRPKPGNTAANGSSPSCNVSPLPHIPPVIEKPRRSQGDERQITVQMYRAVAGIKNEELLQVDAEGDTLLHMAVNKEECIMVEALLKRLEREEMLQVVNKPNVQHYTPLCIAVFMNNAAIAHQLIKAGANVNFQIQRHRSNGMGITYFRLVHYVACRGLKWGETLEALLKADNIDLDYFNSEGLSAVHYAINSHAKNCSQDGGTIDSRHAIYTLFCRGANLGLPDGLSGKTPLHYVVEKKNVDFLSWFLDLVRHISDKLALSSVVHNSHSYLHSIVNARTNAGLTALHIAAAVHTDRERNVCVDRDHEQNMRIVQLLLLNGAELSSHNDAKLYKDLRTKFPELAELIKNVGSGSRSNSRS